MNLRFNDGITIGTSGELRRLSLYDGLYVIGQGYLIPCKDENEVNHFLKTLQKK